ncbi:MAG: hypothetical protein ABR593_10575, partial [Candidatus Limnocylindria bacterium]
LDVESCDGATLSNSSFDAATGAGSFDCSFPDGPATHDVTVTVSDDDGGSDSDTRAVTVANVGPTVTLTGAASVNEGSTHTYSFTTSDPGADAYVLGATECGTGGTQVGPDTFNPATGSGSFDCSFVDGPASPTISVTVSDSDGASDSVTRAVTVANVAPVISSATVVVNPIGNQVTSTFTYSDAGVLDGQTATFQYYLNGVLVRTSTTTPANSLASSGTVADVQTFGPGCYTIEVRMWITDKDGASSATETRNGGSTSTYDFAQASFEAPIKDNERNIAKYGNVVPIKVNLASMCSPGTTLTTPVLHITIALGNATDAQPDATPIIIAESVSNADTGTQMRVNGGGYIYNFSTKQLKANQDYTIRIRVGSTVGPIIARALFQPKK